MQSYILMLQTDADDKEITELVLTNIELIMPVKFLENPDELNAFTLLHGKPSLILINENTNRIGIEIIKRLKNNPSFRDIPLIILKENTIPQYVNNCYRAGASTVITKPSTVELTNKKIETFFTYWFKVAELPAYTEGPAS